MDYKYNTVNELRAGISLDAKLEKVNPVIAQDEFWDFGPQEEIQEIMEQLTSARIISLDSPYYQAFFKFHGIDPKDGITKFPFTRKEDGKYGPGIKDAERRQPSSLQDNIKEEYVFVGANTGSTGDIRIQLPNTKNDLLFEHNRMVGILRQFELPRMKALNLYNPVTLGANTFEGAFEIMKGINYYPQPGYDIEDIINLIMSNSVNAVFGVSRAPGDETGRKGPTRVEDIILDRLSYTDYFDQFNPDNPFLCYVVGSAISDRLAKESSNTKGLIVVGAYGLQEARPLASAFNNNNCKLGNMHLTQFPYYTQLANMNGDEYLPVTQAGERGQIMISTPLKQGAPLIKYLTEDGATLGYCDCGRTSPVIYDIDRLSGEVLTMLGCRA